jgi:hypothetical protein
MAGSERTRWSVIIWVGILGVAAGFLFILLGDWPWAWPHDALHDTIRDTLRIVGRVITTATTFAVIIMVWSRYYSSRR